MDEDEFNCPIPDCSEDEVSDKNKAIEEAGPKKCPLCNSVVRIFYVHYTAKILMCENMKCEYPFGDDVKIYESDDDGYFQSELDMSSFKSKKPRQPNNQSQGTGSEVSTSEWSEIARINMQYDSDDSLPSNMFAKKSNRVQLERVKKQENEEKIKQNVEKIRELNKVLFDNVDEFDTIRNEKWIKNLSTMQSSSGMRLVKEQELEKLKKKQNVDIGELKIDIESREDSMSSIKIEIGNKDTAQMQWSVTWVLLAVFVYGGGGVTKASGIEQFWTDDYKIFEQVYGKTSDKDIYGESLPPSITIGSNLQKEASKKNERYLLSLDTESDELDPYNLGDRYSNLLNKQSLKLFNKKNPATSSINFVSYSDFKPISQSNDPDTYNYLKHLEDLNKEEKIGLPQSGGFKPYLNYLGPDPQETDAYKSIQEILDAHEANKGDRYKNEEDVKYLNYGKSKRKKPPRVYNDVTKPRCTSGRCRKRGAGSYRSRSRPHVRGLKTVIVV